MAEGLLRHHLVERGVKANVSSAGFLVPGVPATEDAIATMADRGIDISDHVSRVASPELAAASDLIVAMTSQHVAELAVMEPSAFGRAFTLRDLVRRISERGPALPDESVATWVARLNSGRTPRDVLSAPASEDIADPIGEPRSAYEQTADELDVLLARLAGSLRP